MASPDSRPVGFLGLGIMGAPMAANLARAGFTVHAWNRTRSVAQELAAEHGNVVLADTPADAARAAGTVITMLPAGAEVEEVLLAAAEGLSAGGLAIDMSTTGPAAARRIAGLLAPYGAGFIDAPVTGSRPKAEDGTLTIMAGGERADFERALPLFEAMGGLVVHAGPLGHGQVIKLVNNTLAAVNAAALAEGLVLATDAGVDPDRLLEVVAAGSGESAMRALKARPMLDGDLDPLFRLEHMLKDLRLFLGEADAAGAEAGVAAAAERAYSEADAAGLGDRDFAAVIEPIRTKSGLK